MALHSVEGFFFRETRDPADVRPTPRTPENIEKPFFNFRVAFALVLERDFKQNTLDLRHLRPTPVGSGHMNRDSTCKIRYFFLLLLAFRLESAPKLKAQFRVNL